MCARRLLGREPEDFDIATSAVPEQIEAVFPAHHPGGATVRSDHRAGGRRGIPGGDVPRGGGLPGRPPPEQVTFSNAQADASRRDFTVNDCFTIRWRTNCMTGSAARRTFRAKLLRTIGEPEERFAEDHLRLLRAVRFAAQLDFAIEPATFAH